MARPGCSSPTRAGCLLALAVVLAASVASAEPEASRVIAAPTAWVPRAGAVNASLGIDHRGGALAVAGIGLGDLAHLELGLDGDVRLGDGSPLRLPRAGFRLGARPDAWFRGQPAVAVTVRTSFAAPSTAAAADVTVADATVSASRRVREVRLHAGLTAIDARYRIGGELIRLGPGRPRLRPTAGLEWTPPIYPNTTLVLDLGWAPDLAPTPTLRYLADLGARYRVYEFLTVELIVRHRQGEDLAATTVATRLNVALF
ncbi:MAG: hypothetical protein KA297_18020 [Kofleriaceae bacterium]|nr:hypothetical protein [Kofleriaceae bacterium]